MSVRLSICKKNARHWLLAKSLPCGSRHSPVLLGRVRCRPSALSSSLPAMCHCQYRSHWLAGSTLGGSLLERARARRLLLQLCHVAQGLLSRPAMLWGFPGSPLTPSAMEQWRLQRLRLLLLLSSLPQDPIVEHHALFFAQQLTLRHSRRSAHASAVSCLEVREASGWVFVSCLWKWSDLYSTPKTSLLHVIKKLYHIKRLGSRKSWLFSFVSVMATT